MTKIILRESQIKGLIRMIKEQTEGEYYEISADDYMELMRAASYESKVTGIKKFKGKPLYIIGNVDLSHTPAKSLGNVAVITGNLDISNTNIADISKTDVKGNVRDYGSEREKIRIRKEELAKLGEAQGRREDGEWDLDNPNIDEEGLAAHALFNYLINKDKLNEMDEDVKTKIQSIKDKIEELIQQGAGLELDSEERDELYDEIDNLEIEIEELQGDYADVYYILPSKYKPYGTLYSFEVIGLRNQEYMVGKYSDMEEAAVENQEQLLDDLGIEHLPEWLINNNIDKSSIRDYMEEFYESDIRDNPDVYFDEDDYELTEEQEERKEQLENYINEMEELKSQKEEELEGTEDEDERANLESEIEEIEDNIEKAQEELDGIEPDTEPTDDMIEEKVKYYIRNQDEVDFIKEMGMDLKEFVNVKGVAEDIVEHDGIGVLSSYDNRYDEEQVKGPNGINEWFVVMRMN